MFKEIRESLMKHLTGLLGNDHIAAELLLLHLLSKVISLNTFSSSCQILSANPLLYRCMEE